MDLYLLKKWKEQVEKARSKQLQPQEYNSDLSYVIYLLMLSICLRKPAPSVIPEEVVDCSAQVYGGRKGITTPYVKKLAKQHKNELGLVTGTGPFRRITPEDVEKAARIVKPKAVEVAPDSAPMPAVKANGGGGGNFAAIEGSSVIPFTVMQAAVANNTMESLSVLTFRVGYPVLTDALDALCDKEKKGVTMTCLLAKATAMALVQHTVLKSTFGSLFVIKKWKELVEKARANQLQPQEYNSDRFDVILPPANLEKLAQAYEVLRDPEKREIYDNYGEDALKKGMGRGSGMHDPFDIFQSFFGGSPFSGGGSSRGRRQRRGEELVHPLKVSLEDLFTGTT
ncbi:Dihydrolipoyllysine-residue acetyltransferase component 4 of pyruvate dehydrogenase complex chloroplastic [Bienertia sinuspersici]